MLYHAKKMEFFKKNQVEKKWEYSPVETLSQKRILIVGYGDIGAACAKVAKAGFGMHVTGVKRNPNEINE